MNINSAFRSYLEHALVCLLLKIGFLCLHDVVGEQELWSAEGEGKCTSAMLV